MKFNNGPGFNSSRMHELIDDDSDLTNYHFHSKLFNEKNSHSNIMCNDARLDINTISRKNNLSLKKMNGPGTSFPDIF